MLNKHLSLTPKAFAVFTIVKDTSVFYYGFIDWITLFR